MLVITVKNICRMG